MPLLSVVFVFETLVKSIEPSGLMLTVSSLISYSSVSLFGIFDLFGDIKINELFKEQKMCEKNEDKGVCVYVCVERQTKKYYHIAPLI